MGRPSGSLGGGRRQERRRQGGSRRQCPAGGRSRASDLMTKVERSVTHNFWITRDVSQVGD